MGKQLQVFTSNQFGQIRTIENYGQSWFVAADVCASLELANPTVTVSRLDKDEKAKFNLGLSVDLPGALTSQACTRWCWHAENPKLGHSSAGSPTKCSRPSASTACMRFQMLLKTLKCC